MIYGRPVLISGRNSINSHFSFSKPGNQNTAEESSLPNYLTINKGIDRLMLCPNALEWSETGTVVSKNWRDVGDSIP